MCNTATWAEFSEAMTAALKAAKQRHRTAIRRGEVRRRNPLGEDPEDPDLQRERRRRNPDNMENQIVNDHEQRNQRTHCRSLSPLEQRDQRTHHRPSPPSKQRDQRTYHRPSLPSEQRDQRTHHRLSPVSPTHSYFSDDEDGEVQ